MRAICFLISILMVTLGTAQTQRGYVKTKGRLGSNGLVMAGTRLSGATVTVRGGNAVVSSGNGQFLLTIPSSNYYLQNVQKQGYVLTDPDVLSKQYAQSKNPLVLVMETPSQQADDKLAAERKIRRTLQRQLQDREDEIEALKAQQKLTEEEYRRQLQELYSQQESNERLISEMAERYSKTDFDEVDAFNRQISSLILEGRLTEADSLLRTKGDIRNRTADLRQLQEQNATEERELDRRGRKLEKNKALAQRALTDIAQDCYSRFEIFRMQHRNDSAAYYVDLRAGLDTTNIAWQSDAGEFHVYVAAYDEAIGYFRRALLLSSRIAGMERAVAECYNNLGSIYGYKADYEQAMACHQQALQIRQDMQPTDTLALADSYYGIGGVYRSLGDYPKALENMQHALRLMESANGNRSRIANVHNAIASIYNDTDKDLEGALRNYLEAYAILKEIHGERSAEAALVYSNVANVYSKQEKFAEAIDIYEKVLDVYKELYGKRHPLIGRAYLSLGVTNLRKPDYAEAERYLKQSLDMLIGILGPTHPDIANIYLNLAGSYGEQGKYPASLDYYEKALSIYRQRVGDSHPNVGMIYLGMGATYHAMGDYRHSLDSLQRALPILEGALGAEHPYVTMTKNDIEELKAKLRQE